MCALLQLLQETSKRANTTPLDQFDDLCTTRNMVKHLVNTAPTPLPSTLTAVMSMSVGGGHVHGHMGAGMDSSSMAMHAAGVGGTAAELPPLFTSQGVCHSSY